jgi:probable blue pigment (indigoidine) exporter
MAGGIVLTKHWGRPEGVGAATIAGWQLTAGGLVLVPLALAFEGTPSGLDLPAIGGYAWLSVVGALLSYPIWFHGIGKLPVVAVSFLPLLSPAVATILGWLFLGESLTPWQGVGFVLALTAIAAAQLTPDVVRNLVRIPATTKGQ